MINDQLLGDLGVAHRTMARGTVVHARGNSRFVVVVRQGDEDLAVDADLLVTSESPVRLNAGDCVLCFIDQDDPERGVILGRIGEPAVRVEPTARVEPAVGVDPTPPSGPARAPTQIPDTLVIEARESITLRVGDGSITIREDGKVLIKGKDLVSHARRVNRIKGGSVAIN
jgi:hypothetical protein